MSRHIVVAFRMPPAGITPGPEGTYLARARSLCARGEALGGQLVAWSAAILAMAWDTDSIEEAVLLATSIREEALSPERAWAGGLSEGELEPLAPDGQRMALAWGEALLSAASLARVAKSGEVLVDGDLRALRAGQLTLVGARAATDAGQRVRGWRLDLEHPWKRAIVDAGLAAADATDRYVLFPPQDEPALPAPSEPEREPATAEATLQAAAVAFDAEPVSSADVLLIADASVHTEPPAPPQPVPERRNGGFAAKVRKLAEGDINTDAREALAELRRERARLEGAAPAARCQASLALAMTLSIAGRPEEALLETLDALGRAREAQDAKAIGACMALLAKLYAGVGHAEAASILKQAP